MNITIGLGNTRWQLIHQNTKPPVVYTPDITRSYWRKQWRCKAQCKQVLTKHNREPWYGMYMLISNLKRFHVFFICILQSLYVWPLSISFEKLKFDKIKISIPVHNHYIQTNKIWPVSSAAKRNRSNKKDPINSSFSSSHCKQSYYCGILIILGWLILFKVWSTLITCLSCIFFTIVLKTFITNTVFSP